MKALFICDHRFNVHPDGRVFSGGRYPYKIWQRYLQCFESITVIGRSSQLSESQSVEHLSPAFGPDVNFVFLPELSSLKGKLLMSGLAKRTLLAELTRADAAIIRLPSLYGELGGSLALRIGKPFAVELVGCAWDALWNHGTLKGMVYAPFAFLKTRKIVAKSRFILYVTKRFLQNRYPSSAFSSGVSDVSLPQIAAISNVSLPTGNQLRTESKVTLPSVFRVGLTGSYRTASKGIQFALRALASVAHKLPTFEFQVIGPGDPSSYVKLANELKLSQFKPKGELPGTEAVFSWLDTLDLYVQPSLQEGLPRALIEAMSRGLPALGSMVGGIPELLAEECLHRPGDWRLLGTHIARAASSSEWRRRQGLRNREEAEQFREDILGAKRADFWRSFRLFVCESVETRNQAISIC